MNVKYTLKIAKPQKILEDVRRIYPDSKLNNKTLWVGTPEDITAALRSCSPEDNIFFACSGIDEDLKNEANTKGFSVRFYDKDINKLFELLITRKLTIIKWAIILQEATDLNYSMRDIISACANKVINGSVFLIDKDFRVSFMDGSNCLENDIAKGLLNESQITLSSMKRILSRTPQEHILVRRTKNGDYCWVARIDIDNTDSFYIFLFTADDSLKNEIPILFGLLIECCQKVNLHRKHEDIPFSDFKALISSLITGKMTGWDEIDTYMRHLPQPPHRYITIGVVEANPSVRRTSVDALVSRLKTVFPGCSAAQVGDYVILMISSDTRENQPRPVFNANALNVILTEYDAHIAFSNATQRLDMIKIEYFLAESTLNLGNALREYGTSRVYYFEDYAEYVYIDLLMDRFMEKTVHDELLFLTNPNAVEIYRYDQSHGTDLQFVLFNYCKHSGNISAASANAYMHRNTFSAKLAQIKEILKDVDLTDRRVQERMLFSCRVFRYYNYYYKKAPKSLYHRLLES